MEKVRAAVGCKLSEDMDDEVAYVPRMAIFDDDFSPRTVS